MATGALWAMITAIPMHDAQFLTLAQWLSPAYPVGAFAWSHGLERTIGRGDLRDGQDLADWLSDVLDHGAGRSDAILLCAAYAADDVAAVADLAAVLAPAANAGWKRYNKGRLLPRQRGLSGGLICPIWPILWRWAARRG